MGGLKDKILRWFQSGEPSPFSKLEVQALTLENHPDNIATFEALSLYEACLKADQAFRQEGIQGAVWVRNEQQPFLSNRLGVIQRLRDLSADPEFGASAMRRMNGMNVKTNLFTNDSGELVPAFEHSADGLPQGLVFDPQEVLEPQRLQELAELSQLFGRCALSSRYEMNEHIDPHYDHWTLFPGTAPLDDRLFQGHDVRILIARHQPSVMVYRAPEERPIYDRGGVIPGQEKDKLKEVWQPATGDYIFTCDLTWGVGKALAHSSPDFSCESEEDCRILDVYDVGEGREISAFTTPPEAEPA
ncbi:MAG: hypothetical protein KA099_02770 [Alphaproteobacteria bacterium]|nr:hypothetical protein [Alphaproteobacteria bacterium]MBP7759569.1 hypothetical protein [Alphaproteobacteria bacterium]MBP7762966.1 hypothetical protein [Alphaproteobacteria bacterium]MBP7904225.1 hypothetical protein [Alphaproteobacteria bacterium]